MATNPLPVGNFDIADWHDYDNNWRELDAEWLRDRCIMRFNTTALRNTKYPTPGVGQVVYNDETGTLELYKAGAWQAYRSVPTFMKVAADDATQVVLEHNTGAGKGLFFKPAGLTTGGPLTLGGTLTILSTALISDATGTSIKTGATTAKLTTDATSLVVDKPVTATSIKLTGTGTLIDAGTQSIVGGTLTVSAATVNGNLTVTGNVTGTFTGSLSATGGTINGVTFPGNYVQANSGFVSLAGYFNGDASAAYMRWRNTSTGAITGAYLRVDDVNLLYQGTGASLFDIRQASLRVFDLHPIQFFGTTNNHLGYIGPVISSATTPTVASYPEGTIWVTP
jgi:hypothetical protein